MTTSSCVIHCRPTMGCRCEKTTTSNYVACCRSPIISKRMTMNNHVACCHLVFFFAIVNEDDDRSLIILFEL
jgi:hypothetical protein